MSCSHMVCEVSTIKPSMKNDIAGPLNSVLFSSQAWSIVLSLNHCMSLIRLRPQKGQNNTKVAYQWRFMYHVDFMH
jgi:hypothetical protein